MCPKDHFFRDSTTEPQEKRTRKKKTRTRKERIGRKEWERNGGDDLCGRSGNFCRRSAAPESCGLGLGFLIFFISRVTQLSEASRHNARNIRKKKSEKKSILSVTQLGEISRCNASNTRQILLVLSLN